MVSTVDACSLLFLLPCAVFAAVSAERLIDARDIGLRFDGNRTETDHFKLLQLDGENLLIGARDAVYNISLRDFRVQRSVEWAATGADVQMCLTKGKSLESCRNYIRVLTKEGDGAMLVCGTNAYRPTCRQYKMDTGGVYRVKDEFPGNGITPYDPSHNSTFIRDGEFIYAGTVADFAGTDPLIYRGDVNAPEKLGIRTERSDSKFLSEPNFVGALQDHSHVFFWFGEAAVEFGNCGAARFARVGRLCKRDGGGPRGRSSWTSFVKARLDCSLPGRFPFHFDDFQAISEIVRGRYANRESSATADVVYAVFNSPYPNIMSSAVCAFSMDEIGRVFAESPFKSQASSTAAWLKVPHHLEPSPRPSNCQADVEEMTEEAAAFARANPLMGENVESYFRAPVVTLSGVDFKFTKIAVDPQVTAVDGRKYDVLFLGTDDGRVLKAVNLLGGSPKDGETWAHVETLTVLEDGAPIRNLLLHRATDSATNSAHTDGALVVVSDATVRRLPLEHCASIASCTECVALRDPYCAFEPKIGRCVAQPQRRWAKDQGLVQSVLTGESALCPKEEVDLDAPQHDEARVTKKAAVPATAPPLSGQFGSPVPATAPPLSVAECVCNGTTVAVTAPLDRVNQESPNSVQYEVHPRLNELQRDADAPDDGASTRVDSAALLGGYSAQSLLASILCSFVLALALGFALGYCCSQRCSPKKARLSADSFRLSAAPPPRAATANNTGGRKPSPAVINAYETLPPPTLQISNGSLPRQKNQQKSVTPPLPPSPNDSAVDFTISVDAPETTLNNVLTNTLPKDYRVKRVYL